MKNDRTRALQLLPPMEIETMWYEMARKTRVSKAAVKMIGIVVKVVFTTPSIQRRVYGMRSVKKLA